MNNLPELKYVETNVQVVPDTDHPETLESKKEPVITYLGRTITPLDILVMYLKSPAGQSDRLKERLQNIVDSLTETHSQQLMGSEAKTAFQKLVTGHQVSVNNDAN